MFELLESRSPEMFPGGFYHRDAQRLLRHRELGCDCGEELSRRVEILDAAGKEE